MTTLIYLHEDACRETHPIFNIDEDIYAFFVWDNTYFRKTDYGFNRLQFIYETMSSLPFDIYEGETTEVITKLIDKYQANKILIPQTPNRLIKENMKALSSSVEINYINDDAFVTNSNHIVEKRFFKFWNKIKNKAFTHNG